MSAEELAGLFDARGKWPVTKDAAEHTRRRDHNPYGFTTWLAGGGVKGGQILGATDEFGFRAVQDRIHVNDLHAAIPRLLGLDHRKLTYRFEGRQQRLTDVGGDHEFTDRLIN